jgi:hypothetical protein
MRAKATNRLPKIDPLWAKKSGGWRLGSGVVRADTFPLGEREFKRWLEKSLRSFTKAS